MRVGLFGGSFNPPHLGHVFGAHYSLLSGEVDKVLAIPVFAHPFGKPLADYDDRLRMCELAFGHLAAVTVSDLERTLGGESRTLRLLQHLRAAEATWSFRLIIGEDILDETSKWHGFDQIKTIAPLLVLPRSGAPTSVLPAVSSTVLRTEIAKGSGPHLDAGHVPITVRRYIASQHLYGSA